jgi:hypothetical protein
MVLMTGIGSGAAIALWTRSFVTPSLVPPLKKVRGAATLPSPIANPTWANPRPTIAFRQKPPRCPDAAVLDLLSWAGRQLNSVNVDVVDRDDRFVQSGGMTATLA